MGARAKFPIEGFARYCLLNGVDELGFLLQQADAITRYEQTRRMSIKASIVILGGDGIGPEVTRARRARPGSRRQPLRS